MADDNTNEVEAKHKSDLSPSDANIKPQDVNNMDEDRNKNTLAVYVQDTTSGSASPNINPVSREGTPPPLPPRPRHQLLEERPTSSGTLKLPKSGGRPSLQSKATTALSQQDIQSFYNGGKEVHSKPASRQLSFTNFGFGISRSGSDADDSASVKSFAPTLEAGADVESLLGEALQDQETPAWKAMGFRPDGLHSEETLFAEDPYFERAFKHEFDEVDEMKPDGSNEAIVMNQWRSKLKHFMILSSAGKPIYSRHGDDQLITNYIGIVQTLISFYQGAKNELKGFTAGDVRFVIMSKGPLNLVAISRLGESDGQLRNQLEALYMQILSTLTLPSMERMFSNRPSYDLRRPLQGTEILLSALADGFTRGSPSSLLSALECLKLRKSHRQAINNTLLRTRSPNLLYGLIVAGGRLVSVVRPKKHSLHPGDLHLIFNMLFEAGSVKAGGGENWIPLCLPGFNNTGFLYMYVSFLSLTQSSEPLNDRPASSAGDEDEVAILLISAEKEGFHEMRQMRDVLVEQLSKNGGLKTIRNAVQADRPSCTDIVPGTVLRHFLYKSRGNVQFTMPSFSPHFETPLSRRR
ncbi:Vacuolar fusion protein mon1 [Coniosporium apollinis]|uniref:Vacuolar fusion protein MON1 n=1 Tax=Coniosporium apollinis TaxID=61459 RepID=A0ABQ9P0R0_9PEZI|nr:Vacuolar fusion protein mon1 [Coniosporium apollinis]